MTKKWKRPSASEPGLPMAAGAASAGTGRYSAIPPIRHSGSAVLSVAGHGCRAVMSACVPRPLAVAAVLSAAVLSAAVPRPLSVAAVLSAAVLSAAVLSAAVLSAAVL